MDNAEEIMQCLEDFSKRRPKVIPRELEDYLNFVARTGDPVYQWALVKNLFKEKLLNVITEFFEAGADIPHYPNVDLFNYETTKNSLLEKIDGFSSAPFTIQRICELLTSPKKQYNRIDKFMRAFEKNILVVSTRDPGPLRRSESENGEGPEAMVNGSDSNSDYNVDVEMEDMSSWKENTDPLQTYSAQASSSETGRTSDSSTSPFISQNGPAREEQTSPEVELMTIEPDTHLPPLEDDLPEPSTSESDLSPSDEETKNNNESDPCDQEPVSTVPCIPEEVPSVSSPEKVEDSRVPDVESSNDNENIVSTSQECKEIIDSVPDVSTSTHSQDTKEDDSLKDEIVDLPIPTPSEDSVEKTDISSKITDDSEVTSNSDSVEESQPLPDTSSVENVQEPESMEEDSTEAETPLILVHESTKTQMETDVVEDLKLPGSPIKSNVSPLENIATEPIEDAHETVAADSSSSIIAEPSASEETEEITQSISENIPQQWTPEPISVDPEITSSQDSETPKEKETCIETTSIKDDQIDKAETISETTEPEPPSPQKDLAEGTEAAADSS